MHASYNSKYGKIKNEREVLMTKTEVIQRLQKDLGIPRFQAYIEDKDYSEEELEILLNFQQRKIQKVISLKLVNESIV